MIWLREGQGIDVEPIPETREALRLLADFSDEQLGPELQEAASGMERRVAGLIGFSISVVDQGITFTYVASDVARAGRDATRGIDDGPGHEAVDTRVVAVDHADLMDEERWHLLRHDGGAVGVASTLSLPILDGEGLVGGVSLYGDAPDTFDGRHEEVARLFGAWAPGAVTNGDLSFSSRLEAARAPERLEEMTMIDYAVGILVAARGIGAGDARARLEGAAARADLSVAQAARLLVDRRDTP